ncbi:hypothetical protein QCA50_001656 [Cerrena zonata]|uniref:Uncharacterized protein n=1 Tax=Cerrena zonata TaxID=2478898 RepID=A0AAW0GMN7_9APHY
MWMAAFRKFIAQDNATLGRRSSVSRTAQRSMYATVRTGALIEEIGNTIKELHTAFQDLSEEDAKRKLESQKAKDHAKEHSGPVRSLFKAKKGNHNNHALSDTTTESSRFSESASTYTPDTPLQRLHIALEALQHQHAALVSSTTTLHHVDPGMPSSRPSPLATTVEEQSFASPASSNYGTLGRTSKRMSVLSSHSDGSVWYDAPEFDGPEEFVLEASPGDEEQSKFFEPDTRSTTNNTETVGSSDTESDAESIRKKPNETQVQH